MLLSGEWRGGSTLAEALIFTTCKEAQSLFLLDEPAFTATALALRHTEVFSDELRSRVAAVNAEALGCHFHHFNHSALLSWTEDRANVSGLHELKFSSLVELNRACRTRSASWRAVKTIRMVGSLSSFMDHRLVRASQSRVVLLIRHPLAIIRSRAAILRTSSKRTDLDPASVCTLMVQDVKTLHAMERRISATRGQRLVHLLRYSDLINEPIRTVHDLHTHLRLHTERSSLLAFIAKHMGGTPGDQTAYSLGRAHRTCRNETRMDHVPSCSTLLALVHPLLDC